MYHILFTHSSADGHLGLFSFLVAVNKAATDECANALAAGSESWDVGLEMV